MIYWDGQSTKTCQRSRTHLLVGKLDPESLASLHLCTSTSLVCGNNKMPYFNDSEVYLGNCFKTGYRYRVIMEEIDAVLDGGNKFTLKDAMNILVNVRSCAANDFVDFLKVIKEEFFRRVKDENAKLTFMTLESFDGVLHKNSRPAHLYRVVTVELMMNLVDIAIKFSDKNAELGHTYGLLSGASFSKFKIISAMQVCECLLSGGLLDRLMVLTNMGHRGSTIETSNKS